MAERGIQAAQIERVLRTGSLTEVEPEIRTGQDKYTGVVRANRLEPPGEVP